MAKSIYIGVNGKARKVKKIYVGVSGKAHKIRKGYVGIGGKARQFFSSDTPTVYFGTADALSVGRTNIAATSIGNYALFGGGASRTGASSVVDSYNIELIRSTPSPLPQASIGLAAVSNKKYALFGGGSGGDVTVSYDENLTYKTLSGISASSDDISGMAVAHIGEYAIFAGGAYITNAIESLKSVWTYNNSLVKGTSSSLSQARRSLAGGSIEEYAIFAGGSKEGRNSGPTVYRTVDAYNTSLTRTTATELSYARTLLSAARAGDFVLFAGGMNGNISSDTAGFFYVDSYSKTLTRTTATKLAAERWGIGATSLGGCAMFICGSYGYPTIASDVVDIYDSSLTRTNLTLTPARATAAATTVGDYAIVDRNYPYLPPVDVFTIS